MNALIQPIADRTGHIGGIETILLDGHTYFFGFDYSEDIVVSPLLADADAMAQFASRYMMQRDGKHDEAYWREMAEESVDESNLCDSLESRTILTAQLQATATAIAQAIQNGQPVAGLQIKYHLLYLLGAAGGWSGPDIDEVRELIAGVSGADPGQDCVVKDAASELQQALRELIDAAPGNWATHFSSLRAV